MYSLQWRVDYEIWKVSFNICTLYNEELTMRSEKWVYIYIFCTMKSWLWGLKSEFKYMYSVQWRVNYEIWKVSLYIYICTLYNEELTMRSEKWV